MKMEKWKYLDYKLIQFQWEYLQVYPCEQFPQKNLWHIPPYTPIHPKNLGYI